MHVSIFYLSLFVAISAAIRLPYISIVTFVAVSNSTSFILGNRTCDQCLCEANSSHIIINCFINETCQFFVTLPRTYKIQSTLNGLLYFPQGIFPNESQCCTPNTNLLLNKLNTTPITTVSVYGPRSLLLDSNGYLVSVSLGVKSIVRFNPNNLTPISTPVSPVFSASPYSIAEYNGVYYVGFDDYILVVHSSNMTQLHNISTPALGSARDMIFLDNGQMMIVVTINNNRLLFFNRSNVGLYSYDFLGFQNVSGSTPHGLQYVNDTFFYLISYDDNTVYAYSNSGNMVTWNEQLFRNLSSIAGSPNGAHVSMDECDRVWVSLEHYGVKVFNIQGSLLGSIQPMGVCAFDTLILDNYIIYVSSYDSNEILRIDPGIQC